MMNRWLWVVGALQGWALWALGNAQVYKGWPSIDPLSKRTLLYIALALPLAFYFTQNIEGLTRNRRTKILIGITTLFALLGAYSSWSEAFGMGHGTSFLSTRESNLFAAAILGFISIPLLVHFEPTTKRWSYHALFETAWRNALVTVSSGMLTVVFWIVFYAGVMLMESIGLKYIVESITDPIFSFPITGIIFGASFAQGLARAEMIIMLRRFWLTISAWLLPLLLMFSVMWSVALPFTGLDLLFQTKNAGSILLWFLALSIHFSNTAYQDGSGEQPYGRRLSIALEYAWPSLLVLVAVAWWAMRLRIGQYGWTEQRVWAVFILLLATLYTTGYAYSLRFKRGWLVNIGKTNIVAALVMSAGLILLLSPLADARRIVVHSQMSRLMSGEIAPDKLDYSYLRWEAGRYGQEALHKMVAGIEHKDKAIITAKAQQALAEKYPHESVPAPQVEEPPPKRIRKVLHVLPQGEVLDGALINIMQESLETSNCRDKYREVYGECHIWLIDLNGDGLKEAVVIIQGRSYALFYHQIAKRQYEFSGTIDLAKVEIEQLLADIQRGKVKTLAPRYKDLDIGGRRIQVYDEN